MNKTWLAGFYDARGCLSYIMSGKYKRPRIIFHHKDRALLKMIQKFLETDGYELVHVFPRKNSPRYGKTDTNRLVLDGESAEVFAEQMLPKLQSKLKKRQMKKEFSL